MSYATNAPGAPGSAPTPPMGGVGSDSGRGLLRVMSPDQVTAMETADADKARKRAEDRLEPAEEDLAAYVRKQFDIMRRHRDSAQGWSHRLVSALRSFNGEYPPDVLAEIREMGGSEIFARIVAVKCRAASALLRDIYLTGVARPWGIAATPDPTIPDDKRDAIDSLLAAEVGTQSMGAQANVVDIQTGQPVTPPSEEEIAARRASLEAALKDATLRKARSEAKEAETYLDDILVEGGFYKALAEMLADLPLFPFACMYGPVVHMTPAVKWESRGNRKVAVKKNVARMFWKRLSPFDLWWSPGASTPEAADFIMRERKSRAEINGSIDVPGFKTEAIKELLTEYPGGYTEAPDSTDSLRARGESREDPQFNETGMYDCLAFFGSIQGRLLREFGLSSKDIPDEARDYTVQLWMIGRHVIKVQLSPSPRERPPFYITSFNKVPGTMVGNALPDVLSDIESVCNATLRALVNNMALSSGPQVAINESAIGIGEDTTRMWPWRIWKFEQRPGMNPGEPMRFFQPNSNAQSLLGVYEKFTQIADEVSAIPRYITGSERMGGAGRTASGLAMLMGNSSKMLQTVAANVDNDIFEPLLQMLYEMILLTDTTGRLQGDERIMVKGVAVAMQRETERQRQIEMLQATANPLDSQIIGMRGRANLLRAIATSLGLDGEVIVPTDEEMVEREKLIAAAQAAAAQQQQPPQGGKDPAAQAQGNQQGGEKTGPRENQGPRVNLQEQAPQGAA